MIANTISAPIARHSTPPKMIWPGVVGCGQTMASMSSLCESRMKSPVGWSAHHGIQGRHRETTLLDKSAAKATQCGEG